MANAEYRIRHCAVPHQSRRHGARRAGTGQAGARSGSGAKRDIAFTIWTLSARFRLRVKSSDSRALPLRHPMRWRGLARWRQPAEAKGHAGHDPDEPERCASAARARNRRIPCGRWAFVIAIAPFPAAAAEQPALTLQELVLTRTSQHRPARDRISRARRRRVLFAVVTAIMLLRTAQPRRALRSVVPRRVHAASRRARSRQCGHPVRAADRRGLAGGLRRARHRRRSGGLGRTRLRIALLAFGSWLDAGKASAMERAVDALRARGERSR